MFRLDDAKKYKIVLKEKATEIDARECMDEYEITAEDLASGTKDFIKIVKKGRKEEPSVIGETNLQFQ